MKYIKPYKIFENKYMIGTKHLVDLESHIKEIINDCCIDLIQSGMKIIIQIQIKERKVVAYISSPFIVNNRSFFSINEIKDPVLTTVSYMKSEGFNLIKTGFRSELGWYNWGNNIDNIEIDMDQSFKIIIGNNYIIHPKDMDKEDIDSYEMIFRIPDSKIESITESVNYEDLEDIKSTIKEIFLELRDDDICDVKVESKETHKYISPNNNELIKAKIIVKLKTGGVFNIGDDNNQNNIMIEECFKRCEEYLINLEKYKCKIKWIWQDIYDTNESDEFPSFNIMSVLGFGLVCELEEKVNNISESVENKYISKIKNMLIKYNDCKSWKEFIDNQEIGDCQSIVGLIVESFPIAKKIFGEIEIDGYYIDEDGIEQNLMTHHWVEIDSQIYDFSKGTLSDYIDWDDLYDVEVVEDCRYKPL